MSEAIKVNELDKTIVRLVENTLVGEIRNPLATLPYQG